MLKYIVPVLVVVAAVGSSRRAAHLQGQPLSLAFIQHQGWSLVLTGLQAVLSSGALAGPRASGTATARAPGRVPAPIRNFLLLVRLAHAHAGKEGF